MGKSSNVSHEKHFNRMTDSANDNCPSKIGHVSKLIYAQPDISYISHAINVIYTGVIRVAPSYLDPAMRLSL